MNQRPQDFSFWKRTAEMGFHLLNTFILLYDGDPTERWEINGMSPSDFKKFLFFWGEVLVFGV
jgi:hypothetical protein